MCHMRRRRIHVWGREERQRDKTDRHFRQAARERAQEKGEPARTEGKGGGITNTHKRVGRLGEKVGVEGVQAGGDGKVGWKEKGGNEVTRYGVLILRNSLSLARSGSGSLSLPLSPPPPLSLSVSFSLSLSLSLSLCMAVGPVGFPQRQRIFDGLQRLLNGPQTKLLHLRCSGRCERWGKGGDACILLLI